VGLRSLHGHAAGRVLAKKVRSGQQICLRCTNRSIYLAEPPVIRSYDLRLLGSLSGDGGPAGFYREEENKAPAKEQLEKP